jgi:hypothetical protein
MHDHTPQHAAGCALLHVELTQRDIQLLILNLCSLKPRLRVSLAALQLLDLALQGQNVRRDRRLLVSLLSNRGLEVD